ncbi:MAG: 3-deoxy-D-manno-octulosonic acid transferase, partial [Terriglobales bacterium]
PRRPERFDEVAQLASSVPDAVSWRRSTMDGNEVLRGGVLVLDSIGELAAVYSVATIAFVGGSLVPRGGHNILEPASFGVPILVGPHTENFRDIIHIFQQQDAVRMVQKADLAPTLLALAADKAERESLGRRAKDALHLHAGATARTADALQRLVNASQRTETIVAENTIP